jgi:hypothetical protein
MARKPSVGSPIGKRVQVFVETHLAGGRIMMIDQRPRIIEDHLVRDPTGVRERALHALQPGR